MDIDVIITTHGEQRWAQLAYEVAAQSACQQAVTHLIHIDECESLGDARNQAVDEVDPQGFIIFLDADDELARGYVTAMRFARSFEGYDHRLFVPALKLNHGKPKLLNDRNIMTMNPCPIGTMIHRDTFEDAGRFWNEPAYEDWSLFRRAVLTGAGLVWVPDAIYHAHSSSTGRNQVKDPKAMCREIIASHDMWVVNS